jgi:hypothetical protein
MILYGVHFMWVFELAWVLVEDVHTRKMELVYLTLWEQNLKIIKEKCYEVTSQFSCELQH